MTPALPFFTASGPQKEHAFDPDAVLHSDMYDHASVVLFGYSLAFGRM